MYPSKNFNLALVFLHLSLFLAEFKCFRIYSAFRRQTERNIFVFHFIFRFTTAWNFPWSKWHDDKSPKVPKSFFKTRLSPFRSVTTFTFAIESITSDLMQPQESLNKTANWWGIHLKWTQDAETRNIYTLRIYINWIKNLWD